MNTRLGLVYRALCHCFGGCGIHHYCSVAEVGKTTTNLFATKLCTGLYSELPETRALYFRGHLLVYGRRKGRGDGETKEGTMRQLTVLYGHYRPTVILIIILFHHPLTLNFILGLIPSFSANPSHRSLSFFLHLSNTWIPLDCLLLLLSISDLYFLVFFLFYTFELPFSCGRLS